MRFSKKHHTERQRHFQDEAIMKEVTVGELTVRAFTALIDTLVDVRIRMVKDELHLDFDEQLKAKDEKIQVLETRIKELNVEIETVNQLSHKSERSGKPRSVMTDHLRN